MTFRLATFRRRVGLSRISHGVYPSSRFPARITPSPAQRIVPLGRIVKRLAVIRFRGPTARSEGSASTSIAHPPERRTVDASVLVRADRHSLVPPTWPNTATKESHDDRPRADEAE